MVKGKSGAGKQSTGPVVLHLNRTVAHDLLQALTQALEPHSSNLAAKKVKGSKMKGSHGKGRKGKSLKRK